MIAGLHSDTSREGLAKAAYDGVVQGMIRGMHDLEKLAGGSITKRVLAVGGGARSLAYRQFIADRCASPVVTVDAPEATARGACVQAAAVLRGSSVADVRDDWSPATVSTVEPRTDNPTGLSQQYQELSAAYDDWYFSRG